MNSILITGRLTKDIEIKQTKSGLAVTDFSVAVQRDKDNADFLDCQAWKQTAEFIGKYFKKGSPIEITGQFRKDTWKDDNGNNRSKCYILVDRVGFVPQNKAESTRTVEPHFENLPEDQDLPF